MRWFCRVRRLSTPALRSMYACGPCLVWVGEVEEDEEDVDQRVEGTHVGVCGGSGERRRESGRRKKEGRRVSVALEARTGVARACAVFSISIISPNTQHL